MSDRKKIEVTCPKCSEAQTVIVWNSLNVTLNPEAKLDFLNKRINILECKNCGAETMVQTELLYHDMEKEFCARYIPIEVILKRNLANDFNRHGELASDRNTEGKDEPYDYM